LDDHGRQGHCVPVVSAAAEGVLCRSIGLGTNGTLACPTKIPNRWHCKKYSYQDGVTFYGMFKVQRKFLYCFRSNTGGHKRRHCTVLCRSQWLGGLKSSLFKMHLKQGFMSAFCVCVFRCI
jgi:hypothetical protein